MKIAHKLTIGYGVMAVLVGIVGFFGLTATQRIVKSFEGGEEQFRTVVAAATEVSSYAKRAEGHLMLYLTLREEAEKDKYFNRLQSLQEQVRVLDDRVKGPEARKLVNQIKTAHEEMLSAGESLLKAYEEDTRGTGRFEFERQKEIIRNLNDTVSEIREKGVALARFETGFLNRQETITAATEASSYAKRAEGHLMLYLALRDETDKEKCLKRIDSLREQLGVLDERLRSSETRRMLDRIKARTEGLSPVVQFLLRAYEIDIRRSGRFEFERHREEVKKLNDIVAEIREEGSRLAALNLDLEMRPKEAAIKKATVLKRSIFAIIVIAVILSLVLGYAISRNISVPVVKLKAAVTEIGEGRLNTRIEIRSRDEIEELAGSFSKMSEDLQRITVSRSELEQEVERRRQLQEEQEQLIAQLKEALAKVKTLSGLLPICSACKKIRDDRGYWNQLEAYIRDHSEAEFSHGLCPDCGKKLYGDLYTQSQKLK